MYPGKIRVVPRAERPIAEELPLVLARQGKSLRWLAQELNLNVSFLSKAVRQVGGKVLTRELVHRITKALDLPGDYFAEMREYRVLDAVRADPELRERIYRGLKR